MPDLAYSIDSQGVATLTLDRPDRHNAFDEAMIGSIFETLARAEANPLLRALVIRGAGRSFCAGGDIAWMRRMADAPHAQNLADARALAQMMLHLDRFPSPTVAVVQGAAFGGGVGLVACCDVAIASSRAAFCLSEARLGLVPAAIGPYVVRAIGARQARRLMLTAETISADAALDMGLVHHIAAEDDMDALLARIIASLLGCAPGAQREAKAFVAHCADAAIGDELALHSAELLAMLRASPEAREGLAAFLERRAPRWTRPRELAR